MFSLKHREHGIETLKSVESVTFDEAKNQLVGHGVEGDLKYTSGVVFVSNEMPKLRFCVVIIQDMCDTISRS